MIAGLLDLLILLVLIVLVAVLVLWAVDRFFPEIARPTHYVVGAVVVILILLAVRHVVMGGALPPLLR